MAASAPRTDEPRRLPWWLFPPSPLATAVLGLIGTTAPDMRPDLGIGYGAVAVLYVGQTVGTIAGALAVGRSDRPWLRPLPMALLGAAGLAAATVGWLPGVVLAMTVAGFAMFAINARAQSELSAVAGGGRARALSLFHVGGGAGALVIPFAVAALLDAGVSWRAGFALVAAAVLAYAPACRRWGRLAPPPMSLRLGGLGRPARWALAAAALGLGIQNVVPLWLAQLLHDGFGASPARASAGTGVYMAALFASRLAAATLIHRVDEGAVLAVAALAVVVGLGLLGVATSVLAVLAAVVAIGAGVGPMLALGIARTARLSGDDRTAPSAAMAGGGITMILFPAAIVGLQPLLGLQHAVATLVAPALVIVVAVWRSGVARPVGAH